MQGIVEEGEWDLFIKTLQETLPTTLRITAYTLTEKKLFKHLFQNQFAQNFSNHLAEGEKEEKKEENEKKKEENEKKKEENEEKKEENVQKKEVKFTPPREIEWYPIPGVAWKIEATRRELKKQEIFLKLRKFIIQHTETVCSSSSFSSLLFFSSSSPLSFSLSPLLFNPNFFVERGI